MSNLPAGTVTFLLTDIEGSTRLWEEDAVAMSAAVEAHEVAARSIISEFGGHLLLERGEGDSLFAVFASPSGAIQAALALQLRFKEPVGGLQLRIRMGLHAGEAQARGSTYFGRSVNRAARIRSVAKGGQIVLSSAVREIAEAGLPPEIVLRDCGRHRLRDLLRSEQLFEVVHPQLPRVTGPLLSLEMHPHNLPVQLTSFVGRQEPLRDLVAMVRERRLVTILGAGGCGKTRLAMQIGAEVLDGFEDGVWLVEAAPIREEAALMDEILRVLQVDLRSGPVTRKALLILDNCEHLREEAARCTRTLIEQVAELHVLTTSREALGLRGERIYPLRSMPIPPVDTPPEALEEFEASALFLERAHEKDPNLELNLAEANAIGEIVRLLDGIPLAIEQAASHIGFLSPRLILARLDEWMAQPMDFVDDPDPRHRTLEAAIDWSYHLLSPEEQTLLTRLAIFVGGWQLEAAEEVCADESLPRSAVVRLLQKLVAKSLVAAESTGDTGRRMRLLEPIRQFAARRLPVQILNLEDKHYIHYRTRANELDRRIGTADQVAALDAMEADIANIRLALDFCSHHHPAEALPFANDLRKFWMLRGYAAEGQAKLEAALSICGNHSNIRAQTFNAIGSFAWIQGDMFAAERAFRSALDLTLEEDDSARTGILHNLGLCLVERNEWLEAEKVFRDCLCELERRAAHEQAAQARLSLSNLLIETSREGEALTLLTCSLPFLRQSGNSVLLALSLARACLAAILVSDGSEGEFALEALNACSHLSSKPIACAVLLSAGAVLTMEGDFRNGVFVLAAADEFNRQCRLTFSSSQSRLLSEQWKRAASSLGSDFERIKARGRKATIEGAIGRAVASLTGDQNGLRLGTHS